MFLLDKLIKLIRVYIKYYIGVLFDTDKKCSKAKRHRGIKNIKLTVTNSLNLKLVYIIKREKSD